MQPSVDNVFILIIAISVFFLLLVTVAMIYFVVKYRREKHPVSENITGNTTLEIVWTIVPTILVLIIFFYGWEGFKVLRNAPSDAMLVKVTGKMWSWSFEYENGKKKDTLLYVPLGKPMKFELRSNDVLHSFYIPEYRIKEDVVPGKVNYLWFNPVNIGNYDIYCAEYCGLNHSYMLGKVVVMPADEFYAWYNKKEDTAADSLKVKSDSLKTNLPAADTLKNKRDTVKAR
jgi:cytochrome c oxidase subunit 2